MAWTKLDVVNDCLGSMGELPINSLPTLHPYGAAAENLLRRATTDCQRGGFWFNTETLTVTPSQIGELYLPEDCVSVWPTGYDSGRWAQRGNKLYDLHNQTFVSDHPVTVIMVRALDFEILPSVMQEIVAWTAIEKFCLQYDADSQKVQQAAENLRSARRDLNAETTRNAKVNLFNASSADFRAGGRLRIRRT